jgi:hypothetical protein
MFKKQFEMFFALHVISMPLFMQHLALEGF